MPDNAQSGVTTVAADELVTVNGVTQTEPFPKAQRIKPGYGLDGDFHDVSPASPFPTTDDGLGADGDTPPALATNARGVRGWLRGIYDRVSGTLTVHVDNETPPVDVSALATAAKQDTLHTDLGAVAKDATLSTGLGGPGSSPPTLPGSGSGLLGFLRAIRDLLAGTLTVLLAPSAGTAFADAGTVTAGSYRGISIRNTSTTANAEVSIRNSGATGLVLDTITLAPNESVRETYPSGRTVASGTIYMQLVSGAVAGTVFAS